MASRNTYLRPKGRDLEIFYLHLRGWSNIRIASELGIADQTVSNTVSCPWFQEEMKHVHNAAIEKIATASASALQIARASAANMMQLNIQLALNAKSEQVKLGAIHDILDRTLGKPITRVANADNPSDLVERMSPEELKAFVEKNELPEWAKDGRYSSNPTIQ